VKRFALRALLFGGILAGLSVAGLTVLGASRESEFEESVRRLKRDGVVVERDQLPQQAESRANDAAEALLQAWDWIRARDESWPDVQRLRMAIEGSHRMSDADRAAAWAECEAWVAAMGPYFERIEAASRRGTCNLDRHGLIRRPGRDPVPAMLALQEALLALEWRLRVGLRRGSTTPESIEICESAWRLATIVPPRCLLDWSIGLHFRHRATVLIELAARGGGVAAARERFRGRLVDAEDPAALFAALEGERVVLVESVRELRGLTGWEGVEWIVGGRSLNRRKDYLRLVQRPQLFAEALEALARYNTAVAWIREDSGVVTARLRELFAHAREGPFEAGFRVREQNVLNTLGNWRRYLARLRVVRLGLAALAFRNESARWPESLDEIAAGMPGGLPRNPLSGEPFVYEPGVRIAPHDSGIREIEFKLR
jgi:hypothetical protein